MTVWASFTGRRRARIRIVCAYIPMRYCSSRSAYRGCVNCSRATRRCRVGRYRLPILTARKVVDCIVRIRIFLGIRCEISSNAGRFCESRMCRRCCCCCFARFATFIRKRRCMGILRFRTSYWMAVGAFGFTMLGFGMSFEASSSSRYATTTRAFLATFWS